MITRTMRAVGQAALASAAFASAGLVGFLRAPWAETSALLAGYYAVLVINSFFSIKTLATISPSSLVQMCFDGVLVAVYILLALSIGSVVLFCVCSMALFLIANVMYAHLYRRVSERRRFIAHKMRINALGIALSLGALLIAVAGHRVYAAWTLCVLYALANVYLLGINPMYRLD